MRRSAPPFGAVNTNSVSVAARWAASSWTRGPRTGSVRRLFFVLAVGFQTTRSEISSSVPRTWTVAPRGLAFVEDPDVGPTEAGELAPAKAEIGGRHDDDPEPRVDRVGQDLDLIGFQEPHLVDVHLRQVDVTTRRRADPLRAHGLAHDGIENPIAGVDRGRRQVERVHPTLDSVAPDVSDRDPPEGRQDVAPEVGLVAHK